MTDVVDTFEYDNIAGSRLSDHVPVKPCKRTGPGGVMQQPIAADALIQNTQVRRLLVGLQPASQHVGPAGVGVSGGQRAVRDAVAEGNDRGGIGRG